MKPNDNAPNHKDRKNGKGFLSDPSNAHKILQLTADTMFLLRRDGLCVDLEIHTDRWFMQDSSYFLGKNIFKQIPGPTSEELQRNFRKIQQPGDRSEDNYDIQVAGKQYYFKAMLSWYDEQHILCQYRDITQRRLLQQRIEIINHKLQEVEKVAKIGHWLYNHRTNLLQYASFPSGQNENTEPRSILLENFMAMVHQDDRTPIFNYLSGGKASLDKEFLDYQMALNGKDLYFRIKIIDFYLDEEGDNIAEGYIQNITDIKERQQELEMITLAVQNSTDYIFAMEANGKLVFGNQKFKEHHDLDEKVPLTNLNFYKNMVRGSGKVRWQDITQQLINTRKTLNFVLPKPIAGKPEILAFDCTSYLVKDSRGNDQIWTFGKDITERVQYEKQVKELNQIMSTVLTNIPMNIAVKDAENEFRYIFSNRMGKQIHWGVMDDIIGKTDFDLFPLQEAEKLRSDDIATLESREESRKIIVDTDNEDQTIFYDQLRLLVDDDSRALLISIERDITKDKLMEQELIDAKERAEESDKLKSAFIANMSHEIRTPLNAIVGFSKIIAETQDPEERKSYYSIVETNNGRLLGLINEILDLSKIESGIMEFDLEPTNLATLCRDIQQTMNLRCHPGVRLLFEDSDPDLIINTDKNRLSQVLNNLIGNSIKFTKQGSIRFSYKLDEHFLKFTVVDTGSGISADKIDKVFDRFIKGDNFTQGTGLGLPICKSIIEKMGGSIWVESKPGEGACFTFTVPDDYVIQSFSRKDGLNSDDNQLVILVAEDTNSNYLLLENMIGQTFRLRRAENGMEAVTMFQDEEPDLVLMDIKMPIMNGIEAAKLIRSISARIPIIALSAYAYDQDRNAALQAGCNDFLAKPYQKEQLLDILSYYLDHTR
jgi:signal transduction histidine kinase